MLRFNNLNRQRQVRNPLGLFALLALCILASCMGNDQKTTNDNILPPIAGDSSEIESPLDPPATPQPSSLFPQLFAHFASQDSSFRPQAFDALAAEKDTTAWQPLEAAVMNDFRPYLVFNADSSLAIDYVSANYVLRRRGGKNEIVTGGPDTEVALVDVKNKRRKRLLFLGTMGYVCEVKWQGADNILIAGAEEAGSQMIPVLWKYNIPQNTMQQLRYPTPLHIEVRDYAEKALNRQ